MTWAEAQQYPQNREMACREAEARGEGPPKILEDVFERLPTIARDLVTKANMRDAVIQSERAERNPKMGTLAASSIPKKGTAAKEISEKADNVTATVTQRINQKEVDAELEIAGTKALPRPALNRRRRVEEDQLGMLC